jgi:diguanylate cyclase (GGDEF)-like protein/PAS domain S-box-containing protein
MSTAQRAPRPTLFQLAHAGVEALLRLFAYYLIPAAIGVVSVTALLLWHNQYGVPQDLRLKFQVVSAEQVPLATPAAAQAALRLRPPIDNFETKLSELPVWFAFAPAHRATRDVIELPSRHARSVACWDGATLQPLGSADRDGVQGGFEAVKSGFALHLTTLPDQIVCRGRFIGPASLTVRQWSGEEFAQSIRQYHRKSGLLDGGMIVLAVFVLITALINRQRLYLLLAGWLVLNLRVGALSAGWDMQWLGQQVPAAWQLPLRAVTIVLYGISTLTLYQALLREHLVRLSDLVPLRAMQWLCLPLLGAALCLPIHQFLPILWVILVCCLSVMTVGLLKVIARRPNRAACWFAASFGVTFVAALAEVAAAVLGVHEVLGVINNVTSALASSVLASLAVAEQMRMETEKRMEAQEKLEHAFEAMPVGLCTLDVYGHFLSANPAALQMLGIEQIVPQRTSWKQFFADTLWVELHEQVHVKPEAEMQIASRDGSRRFMVSATLARGRIEAVLQDVTEKHEATEQLRFMANNDPLTKVYNRRGIEKVFDSAAHLLAKGRPFSLAYVDLDRFKLINDLFGHAAGDEVLRQVCERMGLMLAGGHALGRVGGDEFVIVMPDTAIPLASLICRGVVERICGAPYRVGDKAFQVRGSVGLIEVAPGMPMKDAISTADRACRAAKEGQGDGLVVYERGSAAFQQREDELTLVARLSGPNATEGMFLEMQPIMSLSAPHESLNFEVLLRMRDADGRTCPAGPVIAAAEKSGRAAVIDRWVLSSTLQWIEDHVDSLRNTRFVCMNLSGVSLNDERFVQEALETLARHPLAAGRLCIEITESVALHDLANTRRFIDQVRSCGVRVALDDFGAGYTSFSYLKELPADVLKIDGNFIVNINAHPANVAIVEAIVNLAVNLGMKTIAEWAEDAATVRTLAEIGVDFVQGYAVARSQPPERMLAAHSSASFIRDDDVLQVLRTLAAPANEPELPLPAPHALVARDLS